MIINKTKVRRVALALANKHAGDTSALPDKYMDSDGKQWNYSGCKKHPRKQYTQVSPEFYDTIDAKVRNLIENHIKSMPRGGNTIK
jgi:hypothetical protein